MLMENDSKMSEANLEAAGYVSSIKGEITRKKEPPSS